MSDNKLPKVGDKVDAKTFPLPYRNDMSGTFIVVHVYEHLEAYVVADANGREYVIIS